ncbi:MAG: PQQ-binding-like beta-propeller repeat protein [Phycisphaeraceae bacterium]|nr:PQQ-binding-like beta-propeller repeat protein [Phycisphaeraceae bacterium]
MLATGWVATPAWAQFGLDASASPGGQRAPVYLDDSPAAADLLNEARRLTEQNRLAEAAQQYQRVLDEHGQKLAPQGAPDTYTDTRQWVRTLLLGDPRLLEAYRQRWNAEAQRLLDEAKNVGPTETLGLDIAALTDIRRRFDLCPAGLEASLLLAGWNLERGAPMDAAILLDEAARHPDLPPRRTRWLLLQCAAGLFGSDAGRLQQSRTELHQLGDEAAMAELAGWIGSRTPPPNTTSLNPAAALTDAGGKALWSIPLAGEADEAKNQPAMQRAVAQRNTQYPCLPWIEGQTLVINDGRMLDALDRVSGRRLWRYAPRELTPTSQLGNFAVISQWTTDQRGVVSDGPTMYAVLGRVSNWRFGWRLNLHRTFLAAVDRQTGKMTWQLEPSDLDASLATAFFHGTPALDQGRLYVLIRRNQMSGFHGAFVAAVDAATGRPLWRRHLSSAAVGGNMGGSGGGSGLLGHMLVDGGRLYVADNLGAVTCLDGRDGAIRWLVVHPGDTRDNDETAPPAANLRRMTQPLNLGDPLLVPAGLIVPDMDSPGVLLDPNTGARRRDLADTSLAVGDQLHLVGKDILAVGRDLRLLDGDTLAARWRFAPPTPATPQAPDPLGRPAIADNQVAVAMGNQLVVLDLATGRKLRDMPLDAPGHVVLAPQQVLVSGEQQLTSYMAWPDAVTSLKAQMAAWPRDPGPGLSLASLAGQLKRAAEMLAGIDAALDALRLGRSPDANPNPQSAAARPGDDQAQVFAGIRRLVDDAEDQSRAAATPYEQSMSLDVAARRQLLDRLAAAAVTPADEVIYQLTMGRFLQNSGQPEQAIEHFQNVLDDPSLAAQLFPYEGGSRQARLEATLRITQLVRAYPSLYQRYDQQAQQQLEQLQRNADAPADLLIQLAEQYPLSPVAVSARQAAAVKLLAGGLHDDALAQLRRAYPMASSDAVRADIVGRIAQIRESLHQPSAARRWLTRARRQFPQLVPLRDGKPTPIDAWLAQLAGRQDQQSSLPAMTLPWTSPRIMPGQLLVPRFTASDNRPRDRFLIQLSDRVQLRRAPDYDVAWESPVTPGHVTLLALSSEQALLWHDETGSLIALDGRTGLREWPEADAAALLDAAGDPRQRKDLRPAPQQAFIQMMNPGVVVRQRRIELARPEIEPGYLMAVNDAVVCLADHAGRIVALDRHAGNVLWQRMLAMDQLDHLVMDDDALALAGQVGTQDTRSGCVLALDPLSGESTIHELEEARNPIAWLALGGDGLLLYVTGQQLIAYHLAAGNQAWRLALPSAPTAASCLLSRDAMLLQNQDGSLQLIDLVAGRAVAQITTPATIPGSPADLQHAQDHWYILTPGKALALDHQGRTLWHDAIAFPNHQLAAMLLTDPLAILVSPLPPPEVPPAPEAAPKAAPEVDHEAAPEEAPAVARNVAPPAALAPQPLHYRLYALDRRTGILVDQRDLGPLSQTLDPAACLALHHHLVLSAEQTVILIPDSQ